jgi:hypothetical protein
VVTHDLSLRRFILSHHSIRFSEEEKRQLFKMLLMGIDWERENRQVKEMDLLPSTQF